MQPTEIEIRSTSKFRGKKSLNLSKIVSLDISDYTTLRKELRSGKMESLSVL